MIARRWILLAGAFVLVPLGLRSLQGCYGTIANDGLVDAGAAPDVTFDAGKDSGVVGAGDAACSAAPGVLPSLNCHVPYPDGSAGMACTPSGTTCTVAKNCGEPLCLPMATNKAPEYDFRMEAIYVSSPSILSASSIVASQVVTPSVGLNAGSCGYYVGTAGLGGMPLAGAFNWLLSLNTTTKVLTTGGAPPVSDPYGKGYCFVNETDKTEGGASIPLKPIPIPVDVVGNTVSNPMPLPGPLNIPIFQSATMLANPIILPIRGVELKFTMSTDGNCIGDINPSWYSYAGGGASGCKDTAPQTCPKWFTNGSLAGYITLADAANVFVAALGEDLCALLETQASCMPKMGDYCSTTHSAGGCMDSFWLSATFAANAVKINKTGPAPCSP